MSCLSGDPTCYGPEGGEPMCLECKRGVEPPAFETQASIVAWRDRTFGRPTPEVATARFLDEVMELIGFVTLQEGSALAIKIGRHWEALNVDLGPELADVYITLVGIAGSAGIDLHAEVNRKMQVNRARKWRLNGDGTGQHVED